MSIEGFAEYAISSKAWKKKEEVVAAIIRWCDKDNRRTGKKIAKYFGISDVDVRGIVNWHDSQGVLPVIASGSKGYWATENPEEIQATINHIEHRMIGMRRKVTGLKRAINTVAQTEMFNAQTGG